MGEMIKIGDEVEVSVNGIEKKHKATITSIDLLIDENNAIVTAQLTGENMPIGANGSFHFEVRSQLYENIISIDALREDNQGFGIALSSFFYSKLY